MCGWKGEQAQGFPHLFTFPGLVLSVFSNITTESWASLVAQIIKNLPASQEVRVQSLGWEDPLEEEMTIHSNILARKTAWTEETGRLQSVGFDSGTQLSTCAPRHTVSPCCLFYVYVDFMCTYVFYV